MKIPYEAMRLDVVKGDRAYYSIGFEHQTNSWPDEISRNGFIFEFEGKEPMPEALAGHIAGYACYVRTDRQAVGVIEQSESILSVAPVFRVTRQQRHNFTVTVPTWVTVPFPENVNPYIVQDGILKNVDGDWIFGSTPSELKLSRNKSAWETISHLNLAKDEWGAPFPDSRIARSYWLSQPGDYQVRFEWQTIQDTDPTAKVKAC